MSQDALGQYVMGRTGNPKSPDVDFVLDSWALYENGPLSDTQKIEVNMKLTDGKIMGIKTPNSAFQELGNAPYSLAMRSLVGCTLIVLVKDYDPKNPQGRIGVYMAHLWEMPGFIGEVEEGRVMLDVKYDSMVTDFLIHGYPNQNSPDIEPKKPGEAATIVADGITLHMNVLRGAKVFIMHPMHITENDGQVDYDETNPNYPVGLKGIKDTVKGIGGTDSFEFFEEFLYKPDRSEPGDDDPDPLESSVTGRAIFEYVPNRSGRRYGRLIFEDGGVKKDDDSRPGFWEYDFGPAT
jgi:hypothetical protein